MFRKLSSDLKLLGAFAATFVLAITVAALSLVLENSRLAITALLAAWGVMLFLVLFHYAYRRALALISPTQPFTLMVENVRAQLQAWIRRAERAAPLLEHINRTNADAIRGSQSDRHLLRLSFFQLNPYWADAAKQAIEHTVLFARRYAEQGDHEVSNAALAAVLGINSQYIATKGRTFFSNQPLFNNLLATDEFIDKVLELLRQNV